MSNTLLIVLLLAMVICAVITVMVRSLLRAAVALAAVSALLTIVMFMIKATLAAVFELSVCTGLITAIFISAISLTRPHTDEELAERKRERKKRFIMLPFILAILLVLLVFAIKPQSGFIAGGTDVAETAAAEVQNIIWSMRRQDILGQVILILSGVLGITVLFKERETR